MNVPDKVKISPDLYKRLKAVDGEQTALQLFIQNAIQAEETRSTNFAKQVVQQTGARGMEILEEGQKIWLAIEKATGIDLKNVNWVPDDDGESIRPAAIRIP